MQKVVVYSLLTFLVPCICSCRCYCGQGICFTC